MSNEWRAHLDAADSVTGADRLRFLSTICLSTSAIIVQTSNEKAGLPPSRPPLDIVREAGSLLVAEAEDERGLVVGLISRHWRREKSDPLDAEHWFDLEKAISLADALNDGALLAWVQMSGATQYITTQRPGYALPHAEAAAVAIQNEDFGGLGPYAAAEPRWRESLDERAAASAISTFAWRVLGQARRYTGDLAGWQEAVEKTVIAARGALDHRPSLFTVALKAQAGMQRAFGGQADLTELEELFSRGPIFRETHASQSAYNASARGDRAGALIHHRRHTELAVSRLLPDLVGIGPGRLADEIRELPYGRRRRLNTLANGAYEMALNLSESGRAELYPEDRAEALDWLRLAEAIWEGWATNGNRATAARRASLELLTDPDAVLGMISIAQEAPRPGLRVNTIRRAAKGATRHRELIRHQLDDMLEEPWEPEQRASLLASRAWLGSTGDAAARQTARTDAETALGLMSERQVNKLVPITMAESALATVARASGDTTVERSAHHGAVSAIARMILNATSYEQRLHLAREWAPSIRAALIFAEARSDADLADLVHEVVRRDGIGALLAQVGNDSLAPADAAEAAQAATAAGRADAEALVDSASDPGSSSAAEDSGEDTTSADDIVRASGETIIRQRDDAAYVQAQNVLGPLGSLIDPDTLYSARARTVLEAVPRERSVFLLQLLPSTLDMVGSDEEPLLHRRLSWLDADGAHDVVDAVPLPEGLVREPSPGSLVGWNDSTPLLPKQLRSALAAATVDSPLRLLIVPTGLFHIEFDALEIGDVNGDLFLIERALVTIHTSLTSARHAMETTRPWNRDGGSYAVFDLDALPATSNERDALTRHFPVVQEPVDKTELRRGFGAPPPAVLAMGVHGSDDDRGWAQTKLLPNGETLSAAEALGFAFPEICVLASCHSRVRQYGVDHAGFPTAMFARGATTIIGSIGRLYDKATSEILSSFYEKLYESADPVRALRLARLEWIAQDAPSRWDQTELWSRLVVYGGAHL